MTHLIKICVKYYSFCILNWSEKWVKFHFFQNYHLKRKSSKFSLYFSLAQKIFLEKKLITYFFHEPILCIFIKIDNFAEIAKLIKKYLQNFRIFLTLFGMYSCQNCIEHCLGEPTTQNGFFNHREGPYKYWAKNKIKAHKFIICVKSALFANNCSFKSINFISSKLKTSKIHNWKFLIFFFIILWKKAIFLKFLVMVFWRNEFYWIKWEMVCELSRFYAYLFMCVLFLFFSHFLN